MSSVDCLFCRIVSGEIPSSRVAESSLSMAFRDINPAAPRHVLVIPKAHVADSLAELDDNEVLTDMMGMVQDVAQSEGLEPGWRLVANVGPDGGQTVPHLHFHLLGGRKMSWPPG
ncbi:MAG: histidine triad nucleotide-binding protein [Acidimicrobiia bacterium]